MQMHRVQKLLSNYGYCSRRKAEELIKNGKVKVNDKIISLGDKASEEDNIYVNGVLVKKERQLYLIFNKPPGCVTALTDNQYKTVMDYIKIKQRVFPVGRLDYNTTGILLFTNDGDFANKIMHPSNEIKKTYLVMTDKSMSFREIGRIEKGMVLKDGDQSSPAKVTKVDDTIFEVEIHEGKNHIVKKIFKNLGYKVKYLERIKIGNLELGDIKPGRFRELSKKEIKLIFE